MKKWCLLTFKNWKGPAQLSAILAKGVISGVGVLAKQWKLAVIYRWYHPKAHIRTILRDVEQIILLFTESSTFDLKLAWVRDLSHRYDDEEIARYLQRQLSQPEGDHISHCHQGNDEFFQECYYHPIKNFTHTITWRNKLWTESKAYGATTNHKLYSNLLQGIGKRSC